MCPGVTQFVGNGASGEFRTVAVAAEVNEEDMAAAVADDFVHGSGGGLVAEVAMPAEDALLRGPRARGVVLEKFDVVVCFENQGVGVTDAFEHEACGVAKVGEDANAVAGRALADAEANGVSGIVRDGKVFNFQVADDKGIAGGEKSPRWARAVFPFSAFGEGFRGEAVGVYRQRCGTAEDTESAGMVGVFMGEKDAVHVGDVAANGEEACGDLARAEAGIDEQSG